jgi:hypothetical protein
MLRGYAAPAKQQQSRSLTTARRGGLRGDSGLALEEFKLT